MRPAEGLSHPGTPRRLLGSRSLGAPVRPLTGDGSFHQIRLVELAGRVVLPSSAGGNMDTCGRTQPGDRDEAIYHPVDLAVVISMTNGKQQVAAAKSLSGLDQVT